MENERLDKIISNVTGISRNELKKAAKQGRITLNGNTVNDLSQKADTENDTVTLDGEVINIKKHIYIMLNKPEGVISSTDDKTCRTVIDLIPDGLYRKGLFPAGRLDKDTTGFVLITDDGDFAHNILSPKKHVGKTYIVGLSAPVNKNGIALLENGLTLDDGTVFKPAEITALDGDNRMFRVVIFEGKYHQIKRMFDAVGSEVISLKRIKIGGLSLDKTLEEGCCRVITNEELKLINS